MLGLLLWNRFCFRSFWKSHIICNRSSSSPFSRTSLVFSSFPSSSIRKSISWISGLFFPLLHSWTLSIFLGNVISASGLVFVECSRSISTDDGLSVVWRRQRCNISFSLTNSSLAFSRFLITSSYLIRSIIISECSSKLCSLSLSKVFLSSFTMLSMSRVLSKLFFKRWHSSWNTSTHLVIVPNSFLSISPSSFSINSSIPISYSSSFSS